MAWIILGIFSDKMQLITTISSVLAREPSLLLRYSIEAENENWKILHKNFKLKTGSKQFPLK